MKLVDAIITAIIKRGILYEARNVDMEIIIPKKKIEETIGTNLDDIRIHFKADHMTLKTEKGEIDI